MKWGARGWPLPSTRSRSRACGDLQGVPTMRKAAAYLGQNEKCAGRKLTGSEKRLSYSVAGLRNCDSFREHCCVAQCLRESVGSVRKGRDGVGMWGISEVSRPAASEGLVWMGSFTDFFSVSSGSLTGLHLSIAKWNFLQLSEKLMRFCTFWCCHDFLFLLLFITEFSNLSTNRENGTTNPTCLLPSFSNNFFF